MKDELYVINGDTVKKVLTMDVCIPLMAETLRDYSAGKSLQPLRTLHVLPHGNLFGFMPAYLGDGDYFGAKVVTGFNSNQGTQYPSHMGSVMLFDSTYGALRAMVDATSITEIRTGAVSGVATSFLARKDASHLALLGAGAQARSHIRAMLAVRAITEISIWDYYPGAAEKLAAEVWEHYNIRAVPCKEVKDAVKAADIICTVSLGKEPILFAEHVRPGTHINAVGAFSATTREVSSDLVARSRFYGDSRESMMKECGEFLIPKAEGLIDDAHIIGTVGELVLNACPGRGNDAEITLFDALGLAVEDVACAKYMYQRMTDMA